MFAGTVESITDSALGAAIQDSARDTYITLNVSRTWKGPDYRRLVVTTAASSASCGYPFREGEEYLVYAQEDSEEDGDLQVSLCSRTAPLQNAAADLDALGAGDAPTRPRQNDVPETNTVPVAVVLIFLLFLGLAVYRYRSML